MPSTYPPLPPDPEPHTVLASATVGTILDVERLLTLDVPQIWVLIQQLMADVEALKNQTGVVTPVAPDGLQQTSATTTTIGIAWNPVSGFGAVITYVPESAGDDGVFTALPSTAATSADFTGLTEGTSYSFRVKAVANGVVEGPYSATLILTTDTEATPPAPPTGVRTASAPASTSASLQWDAVPGAETYDVGHLVGGVWTLDVTTPTNAATLTNLTPGTAYTFEIQTNANGLTSPLSAGFVVTTAAAGAAPASPLGVVASNATTSTFDLTWTPLTGVGTPPADPGIAMPALTIAPDVNHVFKNIAIVSSGTSTPAFGNQNLHIRCNSGTVSATLIGTVIIAAGAQDSTFLKLSGIWQDLVASSNTIAYHSPAADGTDVMTLELWFAGSTLATRPIQTSDITITTGATTVENGGFDESTGITYVVRFSGDAGATWTSLAPVTAPPVTIPSLTPAHPYQASVHAISALNVAGPESTPNVSITTATVVAGPPGAIGDPTGMQAVRAYDFVKTGGTNCYPQNDQDGGNAGTKGVAGIASQFNYITGGTGHRWVARNYIWSASAAPNFVTSYQYLITNANVLALPCIDHFNGSHDHNGPIYVATHLPAADMAGVEGINEPNTSGFGLLSSATTLSTQQALKAGTPAGVFVWGASILFKTADQVTFMGSNLTAYLAACDGITSHKYPNHGCYSGNNELRDWTDTTNLGGKNVAITECNAIHYNSFGGVYPFDHIESIQGYYTLCGWVNAFTFYKVRLFIHFTLRDYTGQATYPYASGDNRPLPIGLFRDDGTPHLYTTQIAAFILLMKDLGATAKTFTTGKLDFTVTGLPTGSWLHSGGQAPIVFQVSNGDFFIPFYNEQNQFSGSLSNVVFTFKTNCAFVADFGVTGTDGTKNVKNLVARSTWTNVNTITSSLGTEFRVLQVRKPP